MGNASRWLDSRQAQSQRSQRPQERYGHRASVSEDSATDLYLPQSFLLRGHLTVDRLCRPPGAARRVERPFHATVDTRLSVLSPRRTMMGVADVLLDPDHLTTADKFPLSDI